ncbi:MAG: carboxypeptidase-like regulatory domain-containing protein [Candidatus Eremiobacteraeota bacterium]|nr:carboxypeptidase-like regulatory domain-containing protein [Candidatus Eremiobacteraeota bacterium]
MTNRLRWLALLAALTSAGCAAATMPKGSYGTVFGRVTNSSGQPISGATVVVDIVVKATTDANGSFTVTTVPVDAAGTNTSVCAQAAGYAPKTVYPTVTDNARVEADVALAPGSGQCTGG